MHDLLYADICNIGKVFRFHRSFYSTMITITVSVKALMGGPRGRVGKVAEFQGS